MVAFWVGSKGFVCKGVMKINMNANSQNSLTGLVLMF